MAIVNRWCVLLLLVLCRLHFEVNTQNTTEDTGTISTGLKNSTSANSSESLGLLPSGWENFCQENGGIDNSSSFECLIDRNSSGQWNFSVLRLWISDLNISFKFNVICLNGVNISLTWPVKARNLVHLKVQNCLVVDLYADNENTMISQFPDQIRVLDLSNIKVVINILDLMSEMQNIENISKDYTCGNEDTIEMLVLRNISYAFTAEQAKQFTITNEVIDSVMSAGRGLVKKTRRIQHTCVYKHLKFIDLSISDSKSKFHMELTTGHSLYPSVQYYNMSYTGINEISSEFKQWWNYFEKLQVLDLSYNFIPAVDFDPTAGAWEDMTQNLTLDLRFNNITKLNSDDIQILALKTPNLFINFSNNPLDCICNIEMKKLLKVVHDRDLWKKVEFQRYSFLKYMECWTPISLQGRQLVSLQESDLPCPYDEVVKYDVGPIVALSILSLLLIIIIVLLAKYRREVRIIVYTRLNIVLPCQPDETFENKQFDAFVAYSSADQDWVSQVFDTDNEHLKGFKFCLHYKHFIAGKTIFDNVIDSVEASRHTIIILSRDFVKSNYCMYEFHEAFQQSIIERKRHLIVIMMEDIPMDELPSDLKRCIKTFTFIKKDDFIFHDRLVYAMSYKGKKLASLSQSGNTNSSVSSWNTDITAVSPSIISTDSVFSDTIFKEKNAIFQGNVSHNELVKQKNKENSIPEAHNIV